MTDQTDQTPQPPAHLREPTRQWWATVAAEFSLEPHHARLLTLAAESWDRCCAAREAIDAEGLTYDDRFGQPRQRPEVAVERDSRVAFARLLRELNLDAAADADPSADARPPRLANRRSD